MCAYSLYRAFNPDPPTPSQRIPIYMALPHTPHHARCEWELFSLRFRFSSADASGYQSNYDNDSHLDYHSHVASKCNWFSLSFVFRLSE